MEFNLDLHELGIRAASINDSFVTFVINRHINYTNICTSRCPLCAFHKDKNDVDAYLMSKEEILNKVREAIRLGATELHIVGSHNPDVVIKALTATEIDFLSKKEKMSILEILSRLKDSGLQAMPGGGAEILDDKIRKIICPNKANSKDWLRTMRCP